MKPEYRHRFVGSRSIPHSRIVPPVVSLISPAPIISNKSQTQMRFRTDSWLEAERARESDAELREWTFTDEEIARIRATPLAEPGDTWRIRWSGIDALAGYAICCPTCKHVHCWTTANKCQFELTEQSYEGNTGKVTYKVCGHSGKRSCWTWTGSDVENKLTAYPSLLYLGDCHWHGFLTDGILKEC